MCAIQFFLFAYVYISPNCKKESGAGYIPPAKWLLNQPIKIQMDRLRRVPALFQCATRFIVCSLWRINEKDHKKHNCCNGSPHKGVGLFCVFF